MNYGLRHGYGSDDDEKPAGPEHEFSGHGCYPKDHGCSYKKEGMMGLTRGGGLWGALTEKRYGSMKQGTKPTGGTGSKVMRRKGQQVAKKR